MAFISFSAIEIAVGKAIKKLLWQKTSDNFDDLNSRTTSLEAVTPKVQIWNDDVTSAVFFTDGIGLAKHIAEAGIDVTEAVIKIYELGGISSGILEIDIRKSTSLDFTTSVSIFTVRPSIDFSTASDYAVSTNGVFSNTNKVLNKDDVLRLDIISKPAALGRWRILTLGEAS